MAGVSADMSGFLETDKFLYHIAKHEIADHLYTYGLNRTIIQPQELIKIFDTSRFASFYVLE